MFNYYVSIYVYRYSSLDKDHHQSLNEHEQQLRSLQNKMEASVEFMKQEHSMAASKVIYKKHKS